MDIYQQLMIHEHVTENHGVGSSILPLGTIFFQQTNPLTHRSVAEKVVLFFEGGEAPHARLDPGARGMEVS